MKWTGELVKECELVVKEECFLQIYALGNGTAVEASVLVHAKSWVGCALNLQVSWEHSNLVNCSEKNFHQLQKLKNRKLELIMQKRLEL